MEKNKNKKLIIISAILAILVMGLTGYIVYDKVTNEENNNDINNTDVNETDLNEMLKIIGIKSDDYLNPWLNYYLSDENYSQNANLIMSAYINSYEEEIVSRPPDEVYSSAECGGGAADCHVISKEDAKRIYEKYNFTGTIEDYFKTSTKLQDKYVFFYTRAFGPLEYDINHNITSKYTNSTDVMITDEQEIININSNAKENKTLTYLFKKNTEGNYYLDNVKINNNNIEIEDAELVTSLKETINNLELLTMDLKAGWFYDNDKTVIEELDEKTLISFAIRNNSTKIYNYSQKIEDKEEQYTYTVISKENLKNILLQSGYIKNENILDNLNNIKGLPLISYSDEYKGYIVNGSEGFVISILTYDYKFEKNEQKNENYLYRSVAYRDVDTVKENPFGYTNIKKLEEEEINKDNYNKYSKFKFTFKGNILYSVEKVTD